MILTVNRVDLNTNVKILLKTTGKNLYKCFLSYFLATVC